jgi:argininosuccinate lyase
MDKSFEQFIGSFSYDWRLAEADITGSIAHVKMLAKTKILTAAESAKIVKALTKMLADIGNGFKLPMEEDIHYAVEKELIRRIGEVGGKMHTARSRNDQVATDLRLYLRKETDDLILLLKKLQKVLVNLAQKNLGVIMPGFTHLQPAQPVLASHHLLSYAWMFERDIERLKNTRKRVNVLPLGSAALAGTSFKIDRNYTAKLLGFEAVSENSLDAVSDRDFAAEFLFNVSLISLHLSKISDEIILWMSPEFAYAKIDDKFTSGSSIMPQKRNPDCAEIIRGKTGRFIGNLNAMLVILKALPLAYNRDLQEDKPPVFDSACNIKLCLDVAVEMIESLKFDENQTLKSTSKGFIAATELADYLTRKGMPFRSAHGAVKEIVNYCVKNKKVFEALTLEEYKKFSKLFEKDLYKFIDAKNIADAKISYGSTSHKSVKNQIEKLKKLINGK